MTTRKRAVVVGLLAVCLFASGGAAGDTVDGMPGRYVLHGPAHVETTTFGTHDATADLDVVVSAGRGASALRLELTSGAYA
ncbi:MAG: hypothetical protein ACJ79E_17880, partial [Anaeromyxobacteraceae bacterium]